jgi:hypothetical protein
VIPLGVADEHAGPLPIHDAATTARAIGG